MQEMQEQPGIFAHRARDIERDDDIELGLPDGTVAKGTVVGRDPTTGVALVKTDAKGLVPATFRGLDGLRVGHFAVTVARPGKTA